MKPPYDENIAAPTWRPPNVLQVDTKLRGNFKGACLLLALFGHGAMSELSPLSGGEAEVGFRVRQVSF